MINEKSGSPMWEPDFSYLYEHHYDRFASAYRPS